MVTILELRVFDRVLLFLATAQIQAFKLDGTTVQVLFEYITAETFMQNNRHAAAIILKNILKKVYGVSLRNHSRFWSLTATAMIDFNSKCALYVRPIRLQNIWMASLQSCHNL